MIKTEKRKLAMDFIKAISSVLLVVLFMPFAHSQQEPQSHNEQVTIVGTYDPSINEAFKINSKPEAAEVDFQSQDFTFNFLDIKQTTEVDVNPIKAISLRSGSRNQKYDNYVKAGFGSRISPYLDFYHSSGEKGNYSFNANLYHYSSFNNIKDYSPSPFSKTHAKINYSKFMGEHVLDLDVKYGLNTNKFYGYQPLDFPGIDIPESDLSQMFNLAEANIVVRSAYKKKSKLHHEVSLGTYYYFDKYKTSELNANVNFDLHKGFDVVDALDYQNFGIEGGLDFYSNNDSLTNTTEYYINAKPYFTAKYGQFSFNAGLGFGYLGDSATSFHFWPIIDVNMNIVPGAFSIFVGVNGKLEKQSYLTLTTENPYLSPVATLGWLNEKINVYGGFRASIAQIVGVDFKTGWKTFENMAFFTNYSDYTSPPLATTQVPLNKFNNTFDDGSLFYVDAEISLNVGKDFKLWLAGKYNNYKLDSLSNAYHKPLTTVNFGASYLIASKVKISTEIMYNGKRYAIIPDGLAFKDIELDSYIDINFGIEYKINNNLSAFINGTNLLNKNYEQFYSYPVQGFQVMGGIMYKF